MPSPCISQACAASSLASASTRQWGGERRERGWRWVGVVGKDAFQLWAALPKALPLSNQSCYLPLGRGPVIPKYL